MNFKTTIILIALLVIIGGFIAYDRLTGSAETVEKKVKVEKLVALTEPEVTGLDIDSDDGGKISLAKPDPSRWVVTAPFKAVADFYAASGALSSVLSAETKGEADPSAVAGFKPATTVTLSTGTGRKTVVAFAAVNGVGESVARVDQDGKSKYSIVSGDLLTTLRKAPATYRDLRLVNVEQSAIDKLVLEPAGEPAITLVRDDTGWKMESPVAQRADDTAVGELLGTVTGARASEYVTTPTTGPGPGGEDAFAHPQFVVHFFSGDPIAEGATRPTSRPTTEHILRFGRFEDVRKQKVLVSSEAGVATVPVYSLNSLKKSPADLRDKRVLELKPAEIAKVQVVNLTMAATRPETTITITRAAPPQPPPPPTTLPTTTRAAVDSTWMLDGRPADAEKVDALLEGLHPLRTVKYLTGGATSTQPATPWLLRVTTFAGQTHEIFVGDSTAKVGSDIIEPPAELLGQLKGGFAKAAPALPFLGATDTSQPTTSQPSTMPTSRP